MTEANQKQEEPIQQQSVLQEPNVVETKTPPERHAAAETRITLPDSERHLQ